MTAEEIRLFDYWRSSASYRVRIGLNLAGLDFAITPVDLVAGAQHMPEHRARHPQGMVPTLEIDGLRLNQSLAILDYLHDTGRVRLLPEDPEQRARLRAVALAIAADIHPVCNLRVVNRIVEMTGRASARTEWMVEVMRPALVAVEAMLAGLPDGPFAGGAAPMLADLCIAPQLYNAERWGVSWADLPRLAAIGEACARHPAFQAAHPDSVRHR